MMETEKGVGKPFFFMTRFAPWWACNPPVILLGPCFVGRLWGFTAVGHLFIYVAVSHRSELWTVYCTQIQLSLIRECAFVFNAALNLDSRSEFRQHWTMLDEGENDEHEQSNKLTTRGERRRIIYSTLNIQPTGSLSSVPAFPLFSSAFTQVNRPNRSQRILNRFFYLCTGTHHYRVWILVELYSNICTKWLHKNLGFSERRKFTGNSTNFVGIMRLN